MCIKKMAIISLLLFAIIPIIILSSCCEQERAYSFQGLVYDSSSDLPINEVFVKVTDHNECIELNNSSTFTNDDGYFILKGIVILSKYADYAPILDCVLSKNGYNNKNIDIGHFSPEKYYLDPN